jgi:hypothetical protein
MLHVTNGSSAGVFIARSGLEGDVLTWDDVLHEGPVPANVGPGALAQIRAWFLATAGRSLGGVSLSPEIDWRWDPRRGGPILR